MRKHSLNHITSHQNLKVFLYHELNKKSHYFPETKSQKRDANTKPKKHESRKDGAFGSWLYQSSKQNRNKINLQEFGSKKGIKTTKKNSCSYIGCNTSAEETQNKHLETFNFESVKTSNQQIFRIPVAMTDADVLTKHATPSRDDLEVLYSRMKGLLGKYREEMSSKDKKIKELKKENKFLKDRQGKNNIRKN